MPKDLREAAWNEYDRNQYGDYSDVTHEQTFTAGFDAGAASVDRKAIAREALDRLEDYSDGVGGIPFENTERFRLAMDAVLETIGNYILDSLK